MRWALVFALVACKEEPSKLDHLGATVTAVKSPEAPLVFDVAAIDAWVADQIATRGAVGASLVIVKDGKTVLAKGYGKQKSDTGAAVDADTPFALGSVSKQFLCAAAYSLVDEGKLSMTDTVAKYFPDVTRASDIMLADLGNHVAGYRDYYPLDYVDARMLKPIAPDDLIAQYAKQPLDFEPRTRFSYSNTGFVILARAVEKASGMPYGQFLEKTIFKPLGMTASITPPANASSGHVSFLGEVSKPAPFEANGWLFGACDIWTSANDLAKWDLALAEGKLLAPTSFAAITTPATLADGRTTNYGCGFGIRHVNGEKVLSHDGWVGGFWTHNAIIPRTKSAVILLGNDERVDLGDLHDKIVALVNDDPSRVPAIPGPDAATAARDLIAELQRGSVDRHKLGDDFSQYLDDARVKSHASVLRALGEPTVRVTSRGERGGMEVTRLSIAFATKSYRASMFRSSDGKIRQLLLFR